MIDAARGNVARAVGVLVHGEECDVREGKGGNGDVTGGEEEGHAVVEAVDARDLGAERDKAKVRSKGRSLKEG